MNAHAARWKVFDLTREMLFRRGDATEVVQFDALERTNPPGKLASQFVAYALSLCPRVAMLLHLSFLESGNEKTKAGQARLHVVDLAIHWPGIPPKRTQARNVAERRRMITLNALSPPMLTCGPPQRGMLMLSAPIRAHFIGLAEEAD